MVWLGLLLVHLTDQPVAVRAENSENFIEMQDRSFPGTFRLRSFSLQSTIQCLPSLADSIAEAHCCPLDKTSQCN